MLRIDQKVDEVQYWPSSMREWHSLSPNSLSVFLSYRSQSRAGLARDECILATVSHFGPPEEGSRPARLNMKREKKMMKQNERFDFNETSNHKFV